MLILLTSLVVLLYCLYMRYYLCLLFISFLLSCNFFINEPSRPPQRKTPVLKVSTDYTPLAPGTRKLYVDPVNGDDLNAGTLTAPLKTLDVLWSVIEGGDIVYLMNGEYEDAKYSLMQDNSEWVSFLPYPGHTPQLGLLQIIPWNGLTTVLNGGSYNLKLDFIGLEFHDQVKVYNARDIRISGCAMTQKGAITGTVPVIGKAAVDISFSGNVLLQDCYITEVATGIGVHGEDLTIKGNTVYRISHDGIQITGAKRSVIEGNRISNADDGVDDDAGLDWNRHNDGIHVFIRGPALDASFENDDITIRSNIIYDINGQGVQFNNNNGLQNRNFLVENNIFGPTTAPTFHNSEGAPVENLIYRHNTVIDFGPEGRVFTGVTGRSRQCNNYFIDFSSRTTGLEVYNNIFATRYYIPVTAERKDHNLLQSDRVGRDTMGRGSVYSEELLFQNPEAFDGVILPGSAAFNGGTRLNGIGGVPVEEQILQTDYLNKPRDSRPDIGAYEIQGSNPPAETPFIPDTSPKTRFIDDFSDGNFLLDIWLDDVGVQGLSWAGSENYSVKYDNYLESNSLLPPVGDDGNTDIILTEQGDLWQYYEFQFTGRSYIQASGGPVFLAENMSSYYWIDMGRERGILYRVDNGVELAMAQSNELKINHGTVDTYTVALSEKNGLCIEFYRNGIRVFQFIDGSLERKTRGNAGFLRRVHDNTQFFQRISVDDVLIRVIQ